VALGALARQQNFFEAVEEARRPRPQLGLPHVLHSVLVHNLAAQ
jgi:hypothetical protein